MKFWKAGSGSLSSLRQSSRLHYSKSAFPFFYDEEGNNNSRHSVDIWIVMKKKGEATALYQERAVLMSLEQNMFGNHIKGSHLSVLGWKGFIKVM